MQRLGRSNLTFDLGSTRTQACFLERCPLHCPGYGGDMELFSPSLLAVSTQASKLGHAGGPEIF